MGILKAGSPRGVDTEMTRRKNFSLEFKQREMEQVRRPPDSKEIGNELMEEEDRGNRKKNAMIMKLKEEGS